MSPGEKYSFVYSSSPPPNAVSCQDPDVPRGSCFLAESVYGDGICQEGPGKWDADQGLLFMSYGNDDDEVHVCPFNMFLVVN